MSERAPAPDATRPDLRLVGDTPPVVVAPVRPVLVPPPDDVTACAFAERGCPVCAAEQQEGNDVPD